MKKKGFTLVELLAVIAILAILVVIALPNVLKLFNNAKKNTFVSEIKNVYQTAINKVTKESAKGNYITYISSESDENLNLSGKEVKYCFKFNNDGEVTSMIIGNGSYYYVYDGSTNINDIDSNELKEGETTYDCNSITNAEEPVSFSSDSWSTIANSVKNGDLSKYKVGDTKSIDLGTYGTHTLRIANTSTPEECNQEGFSQSACGFVIEFADIITTYNMNTTETNDRGWESSMMRKYINNDIYNALPEDLKSVIVDTKVISSQGANDFVDAITTDKLYLFSVVETNALDADIDDTAKDTTRRLDYYANGNSLVKRIDGTNSKWWLRSANKYNSVFFYYINHDGSWETRYATEEYGVSPAFKVS